MNCCVLLDITVLFELGTQAFLYTCNNIAKYVYATNKNVNSFYLIQLGGDLHLKVIPNDLNVIWD